jgi:hypothetical protein
MSSDPGFAPRRRLAKGPKRPQYLGNPDLDKFMMMMTSVLAELSGLRDRLDTHEALAEQGAVATEAAVEAYELDTERRARRESRREALLRRVFRPLLEELEAARLTLSERELEKVLNEEQTDQPHER